MVVKEQTGPLAVWAPSLTAAYHSQAVAGGRLDQTAEAVVPEARFALARPFEHRFLGPACLLFHHSGERSV